MLTRLSTAQRKRNATIALELVGLSDRAAHKPSELSGDVGGVDRLVTMSKLSFTVSLPKSLLPRIQAVPGVAAVSYANWFGSFYQDPKNSFPNEAVAENFFDLFPEFVLPDEQREAFRHTRSGAVVGASLARRFHWEIGDTASASRIRNRMPLSAGKAPTISHAR